MGVSADDAAPEGKGHDASEHVLVDARELLGLDFDASLFQDFSGNAFRWCLGKFQHAAWRDPAAVIGSLDGQDSPVVAKHDSGDSPRVRGSSVIAIPLLRCPFVGEPPLLAREHVSHGLDRYVVLRVGDAGACRIKGAGQEQSAERPVLTIAGVYALANAIDQRYRALVLLGTFASLRWAELAALRPGDIDLESCTIRVERPLIEQLGGGSAFGPPKSRAGRRTVPFPDILKAESETDILGRLDQANAEALVFASPMGGPLRHADFYRRVWVPTTAKADLPGIRFHDLRHAGNALTAEAGASLRELMDRMGHSSTRAGQIYQHSSGERQRKLADAVGQAARAALGKKGTASGPGVAREIYNHS